MKLPWINKWVLGELGCKSVQMHKLRTLWMEADEPVTPVSITRPTVQPDITSGAWYLLRIIYSLRETFEDLSLWPYNPQSVLRRCCRALERLPPMSVHLSTLCCRLLTLSHSSHARPAPKPRPTNAGHARRLNKRTEKTTPNERPRPERMRNEERQRSHCSQSVIPILQLHTTGIEAPSVLAPSWNRVLV
jgi:hypothetical protein